MDTKAVPAKLALSVGEFAVSMNISIRQVYKEIAAGRLDTIKIGKRRLITIEAGQRFVRSLERATQHA